MISRRQFVAGLGAAATASTIGSQPSPGAAEPPPEVTKLRIAKISAGVCNAPQYVAEELLRNEGFTAVEYPTTGRVSANQALAAGDVDLTMGFVGNWIRQIDAGEPILMLAGVHVGCFELFASDRVRSIRDLKGKTIGVTELGSGRHVFLLSALSYVGLDPNKDVTFATKSAAECMKLFAEGTLDAYQAFAEDVPELRGRKIGRVTMSVGRTKGLVDGTSVLSTSTPGLRRSAPPRYRADNQRVKGFCPAQRSAERAGRTAVGTSEQASANAASGWTQPPSAAA